MKEDVFIIEAYCKHNNIVLPNNILEITREGVEKYFYNYNQKIKFGQMFLIGRANIELSINDVFITDRGTKIFIKEFHFFGHIMDFISSGCTCGILCDYVDDDFSVGEILKLLQ